VDSFIARDTDWFGVQYHIQRNWFVEELVHPSVQRPIRGRLIIDPALRFSRPLDDSIQFGKGEESMAALQNALEGIRCRLQWHSSAMGHDDCTGFPMPVPWEYGLAVQRRLEKMIEAEVEKRGREAQAPRTSGCSPQVSTSSSPPRLTSRPLDWYDRRARAPAFQDNHSVL
jgi:hypothetical protein